MAAQHPTSRTIRLIKIGGDYDHYQLRIRYPYPPQVPFLRLRGYWINKAGFHVGQRVQVSVTDRCITITPMP